MNIRFREYLQTQSEISIDQLALSLVGNDIPNSKRIKAGEEIKEKLIHSINNGELIAFPDEYGNFWAKTEDIQDWARKYNDNKPEWILPEFNPRKNDAKEKVSKPKKQNFSENERSKVLQILLGMAIDKYGYEIEAGRNSATGDGKIGIAASIQRISGLGSVDNDTVRKYLKEASELFPEAKKHNAWK